MESQAQNSKCIINKKANGALTREKMQKKYTGLKLRSTVSEKRKLREVVRKRGKVPLYPFFHLLALEL